LLLYDVKGAILIHIKHLHILVTRILPTRSAPGLLRQGAGADARRLKPRQHRAKPAFAGCR